jgi:hypothetical protein
MRLSALTVSALLLALGSCASSSNNDKQFVQPNQLVGGEIESRIANIPLQHREDLLQNLLWLSQQGEQSINSLLQGMQHQDPKVRSSCSWALGRIGDRRVAQHLRPYMRDANETVRLEVARTLLSLGDMDAVPELVIGLDSNKKEVRYLCHASLKSATGRDFGYDHLSEDLAQRRFAVLGWRQWWSEYAKDPWFAQSYAREHDITDKPAAPAGETGPQDPDPLMPVQAAQDPVKQETARRTPPTQTVPAGTTSPEAGATGTTPLQNTNTASSTTPTPNPGTSTTQDPAPGTPTSPIPGTGTATSPTTTTGKPTTPKPAPGRSTTQNQASGTATAEKPATESAVSETQVTTTPPAEVPATGTAPGQAPAKTATGQATKGQTPAGQPSAAPGSKPAPKVTEPKAATPPTSGQSESGQTSGAPVDGSRNR